MSSLYNSEPPTGGKVVLKTTAGDLDIELWPKEAPKATRNFVQLCLEGYYDGNIFHRVLNNFIAQTGDPTGNGSGGESIYGEPFKDEFHSRLRFIHRGLIACANENRPHTNGSQFFITLDKCEQLNRKNTIFGTITGESLYNLATIGDTETDDDDRPKIPPFIKGAEVIWNPFEDIVPRTTPEERLAAAAAQRELEQQALRKERAQRKAKKGLLSFGENAEEEEEEGDNGMAAGSARNSSPIRSGMRSAHDVLEDERLVREHTEAAEVLAAAEALQHEERRKAGEAVRDALRRKDGPEGPQERQAIGTTAVDFATHMRAAAQAKRKGMDSADDVQIGPKRQALSPEADVAGSDDDDDEAEEKESLVAKRKQEQLAKLVMRPTAIKPSQQVQAQDTSLMSESQRRIAELKQQRKLTGRNQAQMKASMTVFKQRMLASKIAASAAAVAATDSGNAGDAATRKESEAYDGRVRDDIDHDQLKPAAWRADNYLDGDDEADYDVEALMKAGPISFPKLPNKNDDMARTEHVDDYSVDDPRAQGAQPQERPQGHWRDGTANVDDKLGQGHDRQHERDRPSINTSRDHDEQSSRHSRKHHSKHSEQHDRHKHERHRDRDIDREKKPYGNSRDHVSRSGRHHDSHHSRT